MSYALPFKAGTRILEIGGGDKPMFRPNMDFRKMPTVDIVADLEERWPVEDESYDGVFGKFIIEHVSWRKVPHFASELHRVLRYGGLAVMIGPNTLEQCREVTRRGKIGVEESALLYGGQEGTWEETGNYHKAAFSPQYVAEVFKAAGFSRVTTQPLPGCHTDMVIEAYKEADDLPARVKTAGWYKEMVKSLGRNENVQDVQLNIGSFTVMLPPPFINLDILDLSQYARQHGRNFRQVDVRQGLPYPDDSASAINVSHLIEHLSKEEAVRFLAECRRILKPDGWLRIGTPNLALLVAAYRDRKMNIFDAHQPDTYKEAGSAEKFWLITTSGHKMIYDEESLTSLLVAAGLVPEQVEYDPAYDMYPDHTLYVNATKSRQMVPETREMVPGTREAVGKLKICLIGGVMLRVPPDTYGGLEQIVADLGEALAAMGHDVTIIAPNGSRAQGCKILEIGEPVARVHVNWLEAESKAYEKYKDHLSGFDIIHDHTWFGCAYMAKAQSPDLRIIHTHHGHLSWRTMPPGVDHMNMVGISDFMASAYQRQGFPARRCYNGINLERYPYKAEKGERLAFVGRLDSLKQPHIAIQVAKQLGMGIDVVGGTFVADLAYYEAVKAMCDGVQVVLHPDAPHEVKVELMQNAKALLMPSRFNEPFGLVYVEAAACGTPTIALKDGALPEIMAPGVTGFLCENLEEMIAAASKVGVIDPQKCRAYVEERFSRETMAKNYLELYRQIRGGREW